MRSDAQFRSGEQREVKERQVENSETIAPAEEDTAANGDQQKDVFARAQRQRLPDERASVTHKFSVGGSEGYITVGMYADGRPGEVFIKMSKEGSTLSGVMDGFRLLSSYRTNAGDKLWIITESDRSATTLLLPEEY